MPLLELVYLNPIPNEKRKKPGLLRAFFFGDWTLPEETCTIFELPSCSMVQRALEQLSGNTVKVGKRSVDVYESKTREKHSPVPIDDAAAQFLKELFIDHIYDDLMINSSYLCKDRDEIPLVSAHYIIYVQAC